MKTYIGHAASGVQEASLSSGLSYGTWEPTMVMMSRLGGKRPVVRREKAQGQQAEAESTDAPYRVGPLHSSVEGPVMGLKRRKRLIAVEFWVHRKREEPAYSTEE